MKIYTIDYKKHFGSDGTVYKQVIKIDKELKDIYNEHLKKEYNRINAQKTFSYNDMQVLSFTKELQDGLNPLHLTGLSEFYRIVKENKVEDKNRLKLCRNSIIEVLDN